MTSDHVVLVDAQGTPLGTQERSTVHSVNTPLHLAFSCYVFNERGQVLLSRRSLSKRAWPGVWTNSFCGHPRWAESGEEAIVRHAHHELGMQLLDIELAIPDFRYRAIDAAGIVENEICPVYLAQANSEIHANETEVMQWAWVEPTAVTQLVSLAPMVLSPWMVLQWPRLCQRFSDTAGYTA